MKNDLYIITAINRQTGQREPISSPRSYSVAYSMLLKKQSGRKNSLPRKYMNPRLEEYRP